MHAAGRTKKEKFFNWKDLYENPFGDGGGGGKININIKVQLGWIRSLDDASGNRIM